MSSPYPGPYPGPPAGHDPAGAQTQQAPPAQQAQPAGYGGAVTYPQAYRPGGFAPSPAEWGSQNAATAPPSNTAGGIEQMWAPGQATSNRPLLNIIGITVGALAMIAVIVFIMSQTGVGETTAGLILALVPLTIVLAGVVWLDRWEPEPKIMLLTALVLGAGVATLSSLVINTWAQQAFFEATGDYQTASTLGAVVVAPVVEETFKGLIVLGLFLLRREHFDGPVDGVVYAATVAAGFAFTENILYFARSGPDLVWIVFVMRGLVSPFAHLIFTACIGIAIGMAARSRRSTTIFFAFPVGLVGAMGLHALWNGSSLLGSFFLIFLLIQIPLFIAVVVLMAWLRRQESEVLRARLGEYAQVGWFAPHEVHMLASMRMRSQARAWASGYGARGKEAMKSFQSDATSLAYLRQRQLTGRADLRASQSEHELLNKVATDRRAFSQTAQGAGAR